MNMGTYSKELSVAGLLVMWLLMDVLHIQDATLQYTIMGLIGAITGYGGLKNLPISVGKTPTANVTVSNSAPAAPQ